SAGDLVDHDVGVGEGKTLSFGPGREEDRTHARGHAHAVGVHVTGDKLHRIINRQSGGDGPAGAVDVNVDVLVGILHLQVEHLGDDVVRERIADLLADEDDAILHQPGEQVELDHGVPLFLDHADVFHRIDDALLEMRGKKGGNFLDGV